MIIGRLVRFANTYSWYDDRMLSRELGSWSGRVLDVGCGSTRLRKHLGTSAEYTGIDFYSKEADVRVDIAKERYPFSDASFDYVLCNAVLEHVANPVFVLREIQRVLKPGGVVYVGVPFLQPYHPDPEDYRRYTQAGLKHLLEQHGFQCLHSSGVNGMFVVFEYLAFFELVQFLKRPGRLLNPVRWLELLFLLPIYAVAKIANLFVRLYQQDEYASPGVNIVAKKRT